MQALKRILCFIILFEIQDNVPFWLKNLHGDWIMEICFAMLRFVDIQQVCRLIQEIFHRYMK